MKRFLTILWLTSAAWRRVICPVLSESLLTSSQQLRRLSEIELPTKSAAQLVPSPTPVTAPSSEIDGSLLYRLNGLYRRGVSFRGFDQEDRRFFIAPVVSWKISPSTDLTVSLEYTNDKRPADIGLPAIGDRVVDVPSDRIINEPDDKIESEYLNVGYDLEHRFNDNWKLRNAFRYSSYDYDYNVLAYDLGDFDEETGILNRFFASQDGHDKNYALQTNLIGEFATGSIAHTLLFGVDCSQHTHRWFLSST